jgi:Fe-S-cluster containining protein
MPPSARAHTSVDDQDLDAGEFSPWLAGMQEALRGEHGSDVPCNGCTACCTSSQFIHIGPDETDALDHIPVELLFPAPRLPRGHVVMGYDERGHCPMLIDGSCSIYEHRPRTCRTYDCRVFPAAGVELDDDDKELITRRARRWRFRFANQADHDRHEAVRAAATFLDDNPGVLGGSVASATQTAVHAVEIYDVFLGDAARADPDEIRVQLSRRNH